MEDSQKGEMEDIVKGGRHTERWESIVRYGKHGERWGAWSMMEGIESDGDIVRGGSMDNDGGHSQKWGWIHRETEDTIKNGEAQ